MMNGRRKHRSAKLLALATVLTGAGVAVYLFTSGKIDLGLGEQLSAAFATSVSQLSADDAEMTPDTLDAVTEALAANTLPDVKRSLAEPSKPGAESPSAAVISTAPAAIEPIQETTPTKIESAFVSNAGDRYGDSEADAAEVDADGVTRGQQPAEEQFEAHETDLEFADEPQDDQASSLRARAAFNSRPPTAPGSRYGGDAPGDDSRYGSFDAEPNAMAPSGVQQPAANAVDPFARQLPASGPTATTAPLTPTETAGLNSGGIESDIQPLPEAGSYSPPNQLDASAPDSDSYDYQSLPESSASAARNAFSDENSNALRQRDEWPTAEGDQFAMPPGDLELDGEETLSDEGTGRPGERALEGAQQPALVIQKLAPAEIQVGKPAKFQVVVQNVADRPADAVIVQDEVPQGTRLISTTPRAEQTGGKLVWQLGTLSVGEKRSVEILLMPIAEGEIGSVATVSSSTQASVKTRCTLPQLALRLTAPRQVMIGSEQRVRIELHNPGTGDATGVMLYETVPEELRHTSGPALEFEIGTLRAGETRELELVLTAEKRGKVVNYITARADGNLQVEQNIEFEVIAPELEVNVDGPTVRYLERPATYTVSIGNPGTAPARDIELVTRLPKGLRFVSANNLGEYDNETHAVYWSLAELPQGEAGEVEVVAMPVESGEHEIKVEGRALQGLEDETSQHVRVDGLAAIMFEVRDLEDPIEVGGETSYEIRVVNQGTKAATGVQVRALLEPGMTILSASGETRHAIQADSVAFEPLTSLAPKTDTVYRINVKGTRAGDQRIAVEVSTDDIGDPIRKEESTRVFGDQ